MIPYLPNPIATVGPIPVVLFTILLAVGCLVGARQTLRYSARHRLNRRAALRLIAVLLVSGFAFAHLFDVLAYTPDHLRRDPWIVVSFWRGLSSYGGFVGAALGFVWYTRRVGLDRLAYADAIAYGLAPGWIFGRLGCFTAHDHPGARSDFLLAVAYPDGPRHDLGLYEVLLAVALTALVIWVERRRPRPGTLIALLALGYAPARFALDFLRSTDLSYADPRYGGLTPAQWLSMATLIVGVGLVGRLRGAQRPIERGP